MGRYGDAPTRTELMRAIVVDRYHPEADWGDYLRARSLADDGRRPADSAHSEPDTTTDASEVAP